MKNIFYAAVLSLFSFGVFAQQLPDPSTPDWSKGASLPGGEGRFTDQHRANVFQLPKDDYQAAVKRGQRHAFSYPVEVTELGIPYRAFIEFFDLDSTDPFRRWINSMAQRRVGMDSPQDVMRWLGIHEFHATEDETLRPEEIALGMGATVFERDGADVLTFSCSTCHSAELFGKNVVGLTNRFMKPYEFFNMGIKLLPMASPTLFQIYTHATAAERKVLERAKKTIPFVGAKNPQNLGLDTSLSQMALSLSKRAADEYASRFARNARHPRPNKLNQFVADSKPSVWWNLKYKTRWLSDGSMTAGNPIHVNLLVNEIGRGADLKVLSKWMHDNKDKVSDLTAAVFGNEAPAYLDFLPEDTLDVAMAKRGQQHFLNNCTGCHGTYQKNWDLPTASTMTKRELVQNSKVLYHKKTPVIDVGTDPNRHLGMEYLLKEFEHIRKYLLSFGIDYEQTQGYVPPPLVGIWSRWPYFHNNSAPSLCAVLTRSEARPVKYVAGPAVDPATDYDSDCGGYPVVDKAPEAWKENPEYWFDTTREGMRNMGHDEGVFLKDGKEILTQVQKRELIEFLKTL